MMGLMSLHARRVSRWPLGLIFCFMYSGTAWSSVGDGENKSLRLLQPVTDEAALEAEVEAVSQTTPEPERQLRARYGMETDPPKFVRQARLGCLIADPTCAVALEINAMTAYALRFVQVEAQDEFEVERRNTARVEYESVFLLPAVYAVRGRYKYNILGLGPAVGVVATDRGQLWGRAGLAGRWWLGRGVWAPALEMRSSLSFLLREDRGMGPKPARSAPGINFDLGVNLGGWGAIVIGGQYETPSVGAGTSQFLKRYSAGTFYLGFRGNILWGGPLAASIATQAWGL